MTDTGQIVIESTPEEAFARALIVHAIGEATARRDPGEAGRRTWVVRREVLAGEHVDDEVLARAADERNRLGRIDPSERPVERGDLALVLETIGQRRGGRSRAWAWQCVGVDRQEGALLMDARRGRRVDGALWAALLRAAFERAVPEPRQAGGEKASGAPATRLGRRGKHLKPRRVGSLEEDG